MNKFIMPFLCMLFLSIDSFGQHNYVLKGKVVDENNQALWGATLLLHPSKDGTVSDKQGNFNISNLHAGTYVVIISFVGYNTLADTITISGDTNYKAQLTVANLNLNEVLITDNYAEKRRKGSTLNIEVINDDYLKQNLGGSLISSLKRLPGVSSIDIGSGNSKPVIRGLGFNRVVVVENSIKHEAQQWGADHGLEIDQFAVEDVEVIKGPASLIYGSDAIGGVIDMKTRKLPNNNSIGGILDLTGKSNNNLLGTSLVLYGRKNWFFASLRATYSDYGDYKVPTDSIDIYSYRATLHKNFMRNTAGNEKNVHLILGIIKNTFQNRLYLSSVNNTSGFFANAHGLEPRNVDTELHDKSNRDIHYPYQSVNHFKVINAMEYQWSSTKLELDLGFQRNFRQEWSEYVSHGFMPPVFPGTLDFDSDLEREFDKYVYSGNLKLSQRFKEKTELVVGLNTEYHDNHIDGRGFIIPAYTLFSTGAFAFARHSFSETSKLQLGVRYDYGNIKTVAYYDWFTSPIEETVGLNETYLKRAEKIDRNFSNFTWSLGYNFSPENWIFKANVGKSFRMPIAKELAANGVNYHRFSYEIGDPDLSPEVSYQLDIGVEYQSKKFAIGLTPFANYFSNYIYLNPSPEHDRLYGNGSQKFYYTESKVFRFGGELHGHYEVFHNLQLGVIGEYVYSEQLSGEKEGYTLPFSPPASAIFNIKYLKNKLKFMENAYVTLDYRITAMQNNIVPPEEPTDGYQVVILGLGGKIQSGKQSINISMQVQNLFNSKYFNHTSFYRLINVPEAGRNFVVNVSIPFTGKI